jgi:hypothetical protein
MGRAATLHKLSLHSRSTFLKAVDLPLDDPSPLSSPYFPIFQSSDYQFCVGAFVIELFVAIAALKGYG